MRGHHSGQSGLTKGLAGASCSKCSCGLCPRKGSSSGKLKQMGSECDLLCVVEGMGGPAACGDQGECIA